MYCWPSISAMHGASLVNTRRVVKANFGWTFDHLDVLTINNNSSSNVIKCHSYTCCHNFSLTNHYHLLLFYLYLPTDPLFN